MAENPSALSTTCSAETPFEIVEITAVEPTSSGPVQPHQPFEPRSEDERTIRIAYSALAPKAHLHGNFQTIRSVG
jgi:hypothetical protein